MVITNEKIMDKRGAKMKAAWKKDFPVFDEEFLYDTHESGKFLDRKEYLVRWYYFPFISYLRRLEDLQRQSKESDVHLAPKRRQRKQLPNL